MCEAISKAPSRDSNAARSNLHTHTPLCNNMPGVSRHRDSSGRRLRWVVWHPSAPLCPTPPSHAPPRPSAPSRAHIFTLPGQLLPHGFGGKACLLRPPGRTCAEPCNHLQCGVQCTLGDCPTLGLTRPVVRLAAIAPPRPCAACRGPLPSATSRMWNV